MFCIPWKINEAKVVSVSRFFEEEIRRKDKEIR
jgi:hypothetical protein